MSRLAYRAIIALHPPDFRSRFAADMLWIFDDASITGSAPLLADGLASLTRQWLKSPVTWIIIGALFGGVVPIVMSVSCIADWPHIPIG